MDDHDDDHDDNEEERKGATCWSWNTPMYAKSS